MKTYNKHIKIFEEIETHKNAFQHLLKLKEVATKAASSHSFESGANEIQEFLNQKANEIKSEIDLLPELGIRNLQFSIYELLYPYYNRWGGEILNSQFGDTFKDKETEDVDLPRDVDTEEDLEDLDF